MMVGDPRESAEHSEDAAADDRLDSWKEIAAYLKRDVTTVRRWEKREGLPVHRHLHARRDSVYGYRSELDAWWQGRRNHLGENGTPVSSPWVARGAWGWVLAGILFVITMTLALVLAGGYSGTSRSNPSQVQFLLPPPPNMGFGSVSLSPDGRQLAFTAVPNSSVAGKPLLWIRLLDSTVARVLADTENATFPFWSPNGDAVGFFADGKLWIVSATRGVPRVVCDAPNGRGGTWNRDGVILFAADRDDGILRVPAAGGTPIPVTNVSRPAQRGHVWPEFLPDGNHFIYLADSHLPEQHTLFVGALDNGQSKPLITRASSNAAYANGYLFLSRERDMVAQPFDPTTLAFTGEPVTIANRVQQLQGFDHKTDFSVSTNGVMVYRTMQSPATRLVWRDRAQRSADFVEASAEYFEPALSPDETRVAFALFDPQPSPRFGYGLAAVRSDVWIVDRSTGARSRVTSDPGADWGPVWSPDGRRLVFSSNRSGRLELYHRRADTDPGTESLLPSVGNNPVAQSWSRDGRFLLYAAFDVTTRTDLWVLPMTGDSTPKPLLQTPANEEQAQISPNGRWFAYTSDESGRSEIYVQPFSTSDVKWRISTGGAGDPRWRADGSELFYVADDRRLMAVAVKTDATFEHGTPAPVFDTGLPPHWYAARNLYDVTRDGRFLFMQPVEDDRSSPLTVIINWLPSAPR